MKNSTLPYVMSTKKIEEIVEPHWRNRRKPPFGKTHPYLASEWLYQKNCGFGPEDFSAGSGVLAWWRCSENRRHVWQARIFSRTLGHGCPYCDGKIVSPEAALDKLFPKIAAEWHPRRNRNLLPSHVTAFSGTVVWWQCLDCKYEWQAQIKNRTAHETGCYKCARHIVDLRSSQYSYCRKFFNQKKNRGIDPSCVPTRSKVYWLCPADKDHVWQSKVAKPKRRSLFCPFCAGSKLTPKALNKVKKLLLKGLTQSEIASLVGASPDTIYRAAKRVN